MEKVTPEMVQATKDKFASWDKVIEENALESPDSSKVNEAYRLLSDPTIYAYAFFKDPRKTTEPFRMYPYQDRILNDPNKRIIFVAANQIGKSIALCLKASHFAITHPGKTVVMVSKTFPQSKDLLLQIKGLLRNSELDYKFDIGETETKTEIYFKQYEEVEVYDESLGKTFTQQKELPQSRIICVPATEAALGYAVDLLLIDELAFYEDGKYIYDQVLEPRTFFTKGQIIVFSNPNGAQGIFWELWRDTRFSKYRFNFLDCPSNTEEELKELMKRKTREQIDSTLLAEFTSPEGGFLTLQERKNMQEERPNVLPAVITRPIYIFFDWAKSMDRTVRTIGIPVKGGDEDWADKVYVYEMKEYPEGTPYTDIVDKDLKNLIKTIGGANVAMVGWDNTGVGRGIEDFVKRVEQLGIMAMPVDFGLENKSRIYTLFKLLAENGRIKIPYVEECDLQLSKLIFQKTTKGYLQVHHGKEKDRDDFPDSLAGLCSLMIQPDNPPITATIIGEEEGEEDEDIMEDDSLGIA